MTVPGGFPAPGPQDHEPVDDRSYAKPPAYIPPPSAGYRAPPAPMLTAQLLTAHKPGIVPLRPLQFGDILDGAIKAVRFNPKSMVGLTALVLGAFLVPSAAVGIGTTRLTIRLLSGLGPEAQALLSYPSALVQGLFTTLATTLLSGLLIHVVGQSVLGRKPSIGQTWQATRGRLGALLVLMLLSGVFSVLSAALLVGPGGLLLLNQDIGPGLILLLLGVPAYVVVSVFVSTKISLAAPAIVLEGHGAITGLRRSFALTKGAAFWRILGITLLAALLAGIVGALLGWPFQLIGAAIAAVAGLGTEKGQMSITFVSHLSALLSGAITTPFVAAVTGLLYIDRRMRLEALDVVLLREAQSNPAPRI